MLMTNEVHMAKRLNESFASVGMKEFEGHIPQPGINFPSKASEMLKGFMVTMKQGVRKLDPIKTDIVPDQDKLHPEHLHETL